MESITTYNYEAYYLDYLEGNLSEDNISMLFTFLDKHPSIKQELDLDSDLLEFNLQIENEELTKFEKDELKQFDCKVNEICNNNVNDFLVAEVENEISESKKIELDKFVVEHDLELTRKFITATKLKPNLKEVYLDKNRLKKKGSIVPLFYRAASIAAIGLLMFNVVGNYGKVEEVYNPRSKSFVLQIDSSKQFFKIESSKHSPGLIESTSENLVNNSFYSSSVDSTENNNQVDTTSNNSIQLGPDQNYVQDKIEDNKKEELPIHHEDDNDIAISIPDEISKEGIKLVDMYKPVTNIANNYTNLDVSYQKSVPESDYHVTSFSIGKFSFERKRKK